MTRMLTNPLWSRAPGSRASVRLDPGAELTFRPTPGPSLGVELELLVLDPRTRDLAPGSVRILEACAAESVPGVTAELMQSMIEVKTGVCRDVAEVRGQLVPSLWRMHEIARSLGYGLALAGTHPFHQTSNSVVFGLHVHVGVPSGDEALGVMTLLTPYLPHLLALSANSPYWHSADTGLASSRAALYNLLPHAGLPPYFGDWQEFRNYCRVMQDCKVMRSFKDVYWDIRPRPDFGTVEFRICDAPATLAATLGLVALTRCLVIWALRVLAEQPQRRRRDRRHNWIGVENKWLATRYGLEAPYIRTPGGKRRPLAEDVAALIERLLPIARETGDEPFLAPFRPIDRFKTGSEFQRQFYRQSGSWEALMDHLAHRLTGELEAVGPSMPVIPGSRAPSGDDTSRGLPVRPMRPDGPRGMQWRMGGDETGRES